MASDQAAAEGSPFYVRWSPEHSRFAIELKLDLVPKIASELGRAEKQQIEVGGVLIGAVVGGRTPTLRIDSIEMIPHGGENGAIFLLGPNDQARFAEIRKTARAEQKTAVGFFRSHCRPGPLNPSLADRSMLTEEFQNASYALLLVQGDESRTAAFFVAENGELPKEASVREFRFREADFKALPEAEGGTTAATAETSGEVRRFPARWHIWTALAGLLIVACALWLFSERSATGSPEGRARPLDLKVTGEDHLLKISWNHEAREIGPASTGTVTIADRSGRREIKLGADELKLGGVNYDGSAGPVDVTITVISPASAPVSESAKWPPP
jgi:hypothetical protein